MMHMPKLAFAVMVAGLLTPGTGLAFGRKHGCCGNASGAAAGATTVISGATITSASTSRLRASTFAPASVSLASFGPSLSLANVSASLAPASLSLASVPMTTVSWVNPAALSGAGISSNNCNTGTDTALVTALQNLTTAVNANTDALKAMTDGTRRMPPPGTSPFPPLKKDGGKFGPPPGTAGVSSTGEPPASGLDIQYAEAAVRDLVARNQTSVATTMFNQAMTQHTANQHSIDNMKALLGIK